MYVRNARRVQEEGSVCLDVCGLLDAGLMGIWDIYARFCHIYVLCSLDRYSTLTRERERSLCSRIELRSVPAGRHIWPER